MRRSILVVAPCLPLPADFGGAVRTWHLVRELSREHDLILVAPGHAHEWPHARMLGEICDVTLVPSRTTVRQQPGTLKRVSQLRSIVSHRSFLERFSWNEQLKAAIDRLFLTRRIDLVQYEFTQMSIHTTPRPCPTLINAHNIEHDLLQRVARGSQSTTASVLKLAESRKVGRLERSLWASATGCIATSARDAAVISEHSSAVTVVPNGVDTAFFAPPPDNMRRPFHIVFTGVLRHQPNIDGIHWYMDRVHPLVRQSLPDATITIVGADPPDSIRRLASPTVTVTGHVPDVRPYLHEASVAIVPLLAGGGTRLKIVEAFAAGAPIVTTAVGVEGITARSGAEFMIADTPQAFAGSIVTILTDANVATTMSAAARQRAIDAYDWRTIADRLVEAHDKALIDFERASILE